MTAPQFDRPEATEYADFYADYIAGVPDGDLLQRLEAQGREMAALLGAVPESRGGFAYASGKWTLKEMLLHQIDTERIFAYRALRFARADGQDLRGFEQDDYVAHSGANARSIASLLAEYGATRAASLSLFESFTEEQLDRRGTANGGPATVRALLYILPGHERHHLNIICERYQPIV